MFIDTIFRRQRNSDAHEKKEKTFSKKDERENQVAPFPGLAGRGEQGLTQDRMQDLRRKNGRYRRYCAIGDLGSKIYGPYFFYFKRLWSDTQASPFKILASVHHGHVRIIMEKSSNKKAS